MGVMVINFSTHQSYENILNPLVMMRCQLLGVIRAGGNVRRYCCSGTHLLDVSHVQDRKKLENITRGYSDRRSYASPTRARGKFSLLSRISTRQPDRRSRNFAFFRKLRERQKRTNQWKFALSEFRSMNLLQLAFLVAFPLQIALGISNAQTSENLALSEFVHGALRSL